MLKDDLAGDLDVFLDEDDFAVAITYGGETIYGIFGNPYEEGGNAESFAPVALVKTSDVVGIAHGEALVINETTYYVINVQNSGILLTTLVLSKDAP